MVYECEKCDIALPAGVFKCPKCGEDFDEAVPQDAEVPVRGWQPKPGASDFAPPTSQPETKTPVSRKIVISQEHHPAPPGLEMLTPGPKLQGSQSIYSDQSKPTVPKPKLGKVSPGHIILGLICWPVGFVWIIVYIWQHPSWSVKVKALFIGLVFAAILVPAEIINITEGNNPIPHQNTTIATSEQNNQKQTAPKQTTEANQRLVTDQGESNEAKTHKEATVNQAVIQKTEPIRPLKMVNIGAVFGKSYRQVNRIIGCKPYETIYHAAHEDFYGFPNGATERSYRNDGKAPIGDGEVPLNTGIDDIAIEFDTDDKAQAIYIMSYGPMGNYTLAEWNALLTNIGLPNQPAPDTIALNSMSWNSPAPFHIVLTDLDDERPGKITHLEIMPREIQDRGESQQ